MLLILQGLGKTQDIGQKTFQQLFDFLSLFSTLLLLLVHNVMKGCS